MVSARRQFELPTWNIAKTSDFQKKLLNDSSHESDFTNPFVISPILLLELRRLWPLPFESKNFDGLQDKVIAVSSNSAEQQAQRVSTDGTRVSQ